MKNKGWIVSLVSIAFLAACGSNSGPSSTPKPSVKPSATASASPTPGVGATYQAHNGSSQFPSQDTPINSLPASSQDLWAAALGGVDGSAPGQGIFKNEPPLPPVKNSTEGGLSNAAAQKYVLEFWKTVSLEQWAERTGNLTLAEALTPAEMDPVVQDALSQGGTVSDPNCNNFPDAVNVVKVDSAVKTWLGAETTRGQYALVVTFNAVSNCNMTLTIAGKDQVVSRSRGSVGASLLGSVEQDTPPLGQVVIIDGVANCGQGNYLPQDCP